MNIVSFALRRPVTVLVLALTVLVLAWGAVLRTPRDILPQMGVPVIFVAQPYGGMSPAQMEGFLTYYYEYHFLYITGIEHVESKSIQGTALIKLQFHPGTEMSQAMAETVSYVNRARSFMPAGTLPPFIMRFDAGSVPVGNLVFESETQSVGAIQDMALNRVRPLFATLPGVSAPPPFGGNARTIVIRLRQDRLQAYRVSPDEVVAAVASASSISPAGSAYLGDSNPIVPTNALISDVRDFARIPLRTGEGSRLYVGDLAQVEDASDIPTAYALMNGKRTVYIPVTKRSNASTLAVVELVKQNLPKFQAVLPDDVKVSYQFDQSGSVHRAITGLLLEGLLGAVLSGLMVLLFLKDLRSALIVVLNIPLALAAAMVGLSASGQTVNLMTLGGLALAVGILVDETTVTIESIHHHRALGKSLHRAVVDSGREIALPLLVSMLCILAVFVPSFFMTGAAGALFKPLSLAVGFAMVASYGLSRTLVPVLCCWWLGAPPRSNSWRWQPATGGPLALALYLMGVVLVLLLLLPRLGRDIFPAVDEGQFQLRLRAPAGTRLENTEQLTLRVLDTIRALAGPGNLQLSLALVGTQPSSYPINNIYLWTSGPQEAVVQVQLKPGSLGVEAFKETLRVQLGQAFPDLKFSFEPGDILNRVLSFGSPTPLEVSIFGPDLAANRAFAALVESKLASLPALRDVQYAEALDFPALEVTIDRERAAEMSASVAKVARSIVAATSSSRFVSPGYWADPKTGIAYSVQVELPRSQLKSISDLLNVPVDAGPHGTTALRNLASVAATQTVGQYDRYNMQRTVTLSANYAGPSLGQVAQQLRETLASLEAKRPPRVSVALRGQVPPLQELQSSLWFGLAVAVGAMLLLLWANFQSLAAALVVMGSIPAALSGAIAVLWLSGTSLNLQSFTGTIMAVGVGVSNAILLVSAARTLHTPQVSAQQAGQQALQARSRPILMTALAMAMGMLPMAIGLGSSGSQTAPLGRAVEGGLLGATLSALFVLPSLYALVCPRPTQKSSLDPDDPESTVFEGV